MFNRHDRHETQGQPLAPQVHDGMAVWTADGERLGSIRGNAAQNGYLCVHQGRLFGHDVYVPQDLIDSIDANGVHLRMRKQDLQPYLRTEPPAPAAASTGSTPTRGADTVVGSAQPVAPPAAPPELHRTAPLYEPGHPPTANLSDPTEPRATDPAPPWTPAGEAPAEAPERAAGEAVVDQYGQTVDQTENQARATVDRAQQDAGQFAQQTQDRLGQTAEQTRDLVSQTAGQVSEQAGSIAAQAQQQAGQVADQVRERVAQEAATQMGNASRGLEDLATTLTQLSAQLRRSNLNELAQYSDTVAGQLDGLAARLQQMTPDELASELQRVVREHPEVFVAGVLGLGLVIGRLVSAARHEQS